MSRRKRRPAASSPVAGTPEETPHAVPRLSARLAIDLGVLTAVFAATVGIAELAGAANLGVAIGVGQVAFVIALMALLLRA